MMTFEEYQFKVTHSSISAYKHHPKTKDELIEAIETEINLQGSGADLNCIDTSSITDMANLFSIYTTHKYAKGFNGDISCWDVGNVKNMSGMFYACKSFNGDISNWDVSNVERHSYMFYDCNIEEDRKPKFSPQKP